MSAIEKSAQAQSNEPAELSFRYNADLAQGIEEKWQKIWDDEGTFWAANVNGDLKDGKGRNAEGRPSYFAMDMFPYPSGKGLHVGHPLGYLATGGQPLPPHEGRERVARHGLRRLRSAG